MENIDNLFRGWDSDCNLVKTMLCFPSDEEVGYSYFDISSFKSYVLKINA